MTNDGPFRIALRGGNGGYSVVRDPSEGQRVAAVLRGEAVPACESWDRGPLNYRDAKDKVNRLAALHPNLTET